jgi:ubiquitin carboxyl-terminal hydrolase L5
VSDSRSGWCTIESDPGVFTELIQKIGVQGVQVEELITLDDQTVIQEFEPCYGLIFLFKYIPEHKTQREIVEREDIWFAKQVIQNACATQAILSVLFNNNCVDLGDTLFSLKFETMTFDAESKGWGIGESEIIKTVHNSFARPEPFEIKEAPAKSGDDVYHFVSYVPWEGRIFELDGLQRGPIDHGPFEGHWMVEAINAIKKRIAMYNVDTEMGFTVLAVCRNLKEKYEEERDTKTKELYSIIAELEGNLDDNKRISLDDRMKVLNDDISFLQSRIEGEISKMSKYTEENIRRRHNYIPFLFNFLSALAKKKKLVPLVEKAKEKQQTE